MEEDLLLKQPSDRRLGNAASLPPGPPGAECDAIEFGQKDVPKSSEKDSKSSKRRSPSCSPPSSKRSSRNRRSPSPSPRRRSSPSQRRRYRDYYSPDRRRYDGGRSRRSPLRRDPRITMRDRFRGRGRSSSRSRSGSPSLRRGRGSSGNSRWSPKKKPHSPPPNAPPPPPNVSIPTQNPTRAQYQVMPPQIFGGDTYGAPYNQYNVPPPPVGFGGQPNAYTMQPPPAPTYSTGYSPAAAWGVNESFTQQEWMRQQSLPDPNQMPPQMQTPTTITSMVPPPLQIQQRQTGVQQLNNLTETTSEITESKSAQKVKMHLLKQHTASNSKFTLFIVKPFAVVL